MQSVQKANEGKCQKAANQDTTEAKYVAKSGDLRYHNLSLKYIPINHHHFSCTKRESRYDRSQKYVLKTCYLRYHNICQIFGGKFWSKISLSQPWTNLRFGKKSSKEIFEEFHKSFISKWCLIFLAVNVETNRGLFLSTVLKWIECKQAHKAR